MQTVFDKIINILLRPPFNNDLCAKVIFLQNKCKRFTTIHTYASNQY